MQQSQQTSTGSIVLKPPAEVDLTSIVSSSFLIVTVSLYLNHTQGLTGRVQATEPNAFSVGGFSDVFKGTLDGFDGTVIVQFACPACGPFNQILGCYQSPPYGAI
jgi:hypothetical protein